MLTEPDQQCDRCGMPSGAMGHLRSDGSWACTREALRDWEDAFLALFTDVGPEPEVVGDFEPVQRSSSDELPASMFSQS